MTLLHLELDDEVACKDNVHVHDDLLPADVLVVHLDSRDPRWNLSESCPKAILFSGVEDVQQLSCVP